jgi:hypothetical protein
MSRNVVVASVLLWTAVAVVALVDLASGDWLTPAVMTVAGIGFVAVRRPRRMRLEAAAS